MPYGILKVDTITFTAGGVDTSVSISGLVQNPTFTGNITSTGTISGNIIRGGTTVSGATVTGTAGQFGTLTGNTAGFTTVTGATVTGTTANFVTVSGTTVTGSFGNFTSITGATVAITSGVFASGTAAAPSITFTGDVDTGVFASAANQVSFTTSGTERLRIDGTGQIEAVSLGTAAAPVFSFTTDPDTGIYSPAANELAISTGGSGRLFVEADGDVCIGQNAGNSQLTVKGSTSTRTVSQFIANDTNTTTMSVWERSDGAVSSRLIYDGTGLIKFGTSTAHALTLDTNNTEKLRITSTGDLNFKGAGTAGSTQAVSFNGSAPVNSLVIDSSGRLGVGTSSPTNTAGFSQQLQLSGNLPCISIDNTGTGANKYSLGVNSVGALGIWDNTASAFRMYINSSGSVGIGTSSPAGKVMILGADTTSFGTITNGALNLGTANGTTNGRFVNLNFGYDGGATNAPAAIGFTYTAQTGNGAGALYFGTRSVTTDTAPTERMVITAAGNVGIGTTSPGALLDCKVTSSKFVRITEDQAASNTGVIRCTESDGTNRGMGVAGNFIAFLQGADNTSTITERARIDSLGRLLVGTSSSRSPAIWTSPLLQVESTSYTSSSISVINNQNADAEPALTFGKSRGTSVGSNTAVTSGDIIGNINFQGADGSGLIRAAQIFCAIDGTPGASDMPGRLVFSTTADGASSPTERFRIANTGRGSYFSSSSSGFQFSSSPGAGVTDNIIEGLYGATGVTTGTLSFLVRTNGNVLNTNSSYGALSDLKLKENIVDAASQWDDIKALRVRKYNFKEGQTHTQIGVIAQEVEQVSPGLVTESPDRDAEGNDLGTTTKAVQYSVLYMKAVKALQEAMERIEQLEAKVAALESA